MISELVNVSGAPEKTGVITQDVVAAQVAKQKSISIQDTVLLALASDAVDQDSEMTSQTVAIETGINRVRVEVVFQAMVEEGLIDRLSNNEKCFGLTSKGKRYLVDQELV